MRRVRGSAQLGSHGRERRRILVVSVHVAQLRGQPGEGLAIESTVLFDAVQRAGTQLVEVPAGLGDANHRHVELAAFRECLQRRKDLLVSEITEVWRRGSVIASWLLDLTATSLIEDPALARFGGHVSDSGEGRWTIMAAIDEAVPAPVLSAALYSRFSSRGQADFQNQVLSAMRFQFGGHVEKSHDKSK